MNRRKAAEWCAKRLKANRPQFEELKRKASERFGLNCVVRNSEILNALSESKQAVFRKSLRVRAVRSLSGVSVLAVMTRPYNCPHGSCIYCAGGPKSGSAKSYTGFEPAAMRAKQNDFDPYRQVASRLEQLSAIGHEPVKCEVIVMGGTFNAQPTAYQRAFVKGIYEGVNGRKAGSLEAAIKLNEKAEKRVIGLTFETRPDYATEKQLGKLLEFGATRIELGVQTLDDKVLEKVKRKCTVEDTATATKTSKDAFLKVGYHWMPGLFSDPKKDVRMFRQLFEDERFRPDMLKIYPCLVLEGTGLHELWKKGKFKPYDATQAAKVIAECKRFVPEYCRIMRVDRDIPTNLIAAGVKQSNLRELAKNEMERHGWKCRCIRCREAGLSSRQGKKVDWKEVELKRMDYEASGGKEIFLSYEDSQLLLGFLRLRLCNSGAGVRELHVYGEALPLGRKKNGAMQHRNLGRKLLAEAEKIAAGEGFKKLRIISGVGVREYYRKLGYRLEGTYMAKRL